MRKIPLVIDTDPGIDDAFALCVALCHEKLDVRLLTTVAGNVSVDKTTQNALKLLDFLGKSIPVAKGAAKPLIRKFEDAAHIHGESGMDGYTFSEPTQTVLSIPALEALKNTVLEAKAACQKITLVPIGPLTNIALFISVYPELMGDIDRIVLMGGAFSGGNHTPVAEFNFFVDPEAAKIVFQSGIEIVMVGLDVTSVATLTPEMIQNLATMNRTGAMLHALFKHYRGGSLVTGLKMHDLCAIAYLVNPELFTTQSVFVDIETQGSYSSGQSIVDFKGRYAQTANANVCTKIDVEAFRVWVMQQVHHLP